MWRHCFPQSLLKSSSGDAARGGATREREREREDRERERESKYINEFVH